MALAGIAYFDRRPLSREDLSRLGALPSESQLQIAGVRSVACTASRVLRDQAASCEIFGWDGRLDDRRTVALPDEVLARSAYVSWGAAGFTSLVGDWSLATWDGDAAEVILASDYAGIRPLYYHANSAQVVWSSSLQHLTEWIGSTELSSDYAADFLMRGSAIGCTPIAGIHPVPPGCALRIGRDGVRCERFWRPPIDTHIRYADERDYEEHLRLLFEQAVRSRLRDSTPVCAELSGGLDSSSIVCMANSLIAGRSVPAGELVAFSYRGADASDETFWRDVARACAIDTTEIQVRDHPFASPACVGKGAPLCWEPRFEELRRRMRALGSTMLLTGRMGDIVMGNWFDGSEQICDSLSRHDWRSGFTEACRWSQTLQEPVFSIAKKARLLAKARWASSAAADSFSPALRQLAREREEQRFDPAFWKSVAVGRRDRLHGILSLLDSRSLECPEPLAGLLCSHPFAHRPLVEFMLSIPANIVYGPGEPRRLMKRAFSKLLPPRILRRKSKTSYTADFRRALRPMAGQLLRENHELRVCEYGYVEPASLKTRLQRFIDGLECGEAQLRNILLFEFWLRNRETRPSHAEASVNLSELVQQPA